MELTRSSGLVRLNLCRRSGWRKNVWYEQKCSYKLSMVVYKCSSRNWSRQHLRKREDSCVYSSGLLFGQDSRGQFTGSRVRGGNSTNSRTKNGDKIDGWTRRARERGWCLNKRCIVLYCIVIANRMMEGK